MGRPSGEHNAPSRSTACFTCPEHDRIGSMEARLRVLDGNGKDLRGGQVGRLESTLNWVIVTAILTLLSSVGTLFAMVMKKTP